MHKLTIPGLIVLIFCLPTTQSSAQQTGVTPSPAKRTSAPAATRSAVCGEHIQTFNAELEKDGHWLGGSGYGLGYPASGYWLGGSGLLEPMEMYSTGMRVSARSGYEVRTLLAAATILARNGKQQPCEEALLAAEDVYKTYVADLQSRKVPVLKKANWREQQIADAKPVSQQAVPMRSDELIGTELINMKNEPLGSVDDLILDPASGKIAYLVVSRGGLFGVGAEYVPVPWSHLKITPKLDLLVLNASRSVMEDAPQVGYSFSEPEKSSGQDQKADAYWKAHLSETSN